MELSLLLGVGELHSPPILAPACRAPACSCTFQLPPWRWDQQELHCLASWGPAACLCSYLWEPSTVPVSPAPDHPSHCHSLQAQAWTAPCWRSWDSPGSHQGSYSPDQTVQTLKPLSANCLLLPLPLHRNIIASN